MDNELTPEQAALQAVNAMREAAIAGLLVHLDAFVDAINALDPELFFGGIPVKVNAARMQAQVMRNQVAECIGQPAGPVNP